MAAQAGTQADGRWTAILLAGQRPGPDPLASHFGETWKALVPVVGRPMIARVIETLLVAPEIGRILVVAQEPEVLLNTAGHDPRIATATSGSGIAASLADLLESGAAEWPVLVTTADHPLLTPAIIAQFLRGADDSDLAIGAVERRTMLATYPETKRTWLKFADGAWSGANLFAFRNAKVLPALRFWARAERDRKQALKLFRHFGPWLFLRALTRTIGFAAAIRKAGRGFGIDARLVPLSEPEAAIDVDKPADHALVEQILAKRAR